MIPWPLYDGPASTVDRRKLCEKREWTGFQVQGLLYETYIDDMCKQGKGGNFRGAYKQGVVFNPGVCGD